MILKTVGIAFSALLCSSHALATPQPMIEELFTASRTPGGQVVSYPEGTPEMRVYRITIPVGAKIPLHIHPSPVVVVVEKGRLSNVRIIDGVEVSDETIIKAFELIETKRQEVTLTYFEFSTLAALIIFAEAKIDLAILEVGLGGRLDSVNVVDNDVSVITNIAIDHTDYLGDTREAIGREKAGIMRTSRPCICGDQDPPQSLLSYAKEIGAPITFVSEGYQDDIGLEGAHQRINASVAIKAVEKMMDRFEVTDQMIIEGVKNATIKARFEKKYVGDKTFILDVAHNPAAVKTLVDTLEESPMSTVAIFSALIDKDIIDMVNLASKSIQHWYLVPLSSERAIESNDLKSKFSDPSSTTICEDMNSAIQKSLALENIQRVVIFGSFYTIADATLIVDNL